MHTSVEISLSPGQKWTTLGHLIRNVGKARVCKALDFSSEVKLCSSALVNSPEFLLAVTRSCGNMKDGGGRGFYGM